MIHTLITMKHINLITVWNVNALCEHKSCIKWQYLSVESLEITEMHFMSVILWEMSTGSYDFKLTYFLLEKKYTLFEPKSLKVYVLNNISWPIGQWPRSSMVRTVTCSEFSDHYYSSRFPRNSKYLEEMFSL